MKSTSSNRVWILDCTIIIGVTPKSSPQPPSFNLSPFLLLLLLVLTAIASETNTIPGAKAFSAPPNKPNYNCPYTTTPTTTGPLGAEKTTITVSASSFDNNNNNNMKSTTSSGRALKKKMQQMVHFVQSEMALRKEPEKAVMMQKYVKTDMPMYGLQKPIRAQVEKLLHEHFVIDSFEVYRARIATLWELPHREEKYLALDLARKYSKTFLLEDPEIMLDMLESMMREDYMWWDLCDPISIDLVGSVARQHTTLVETRMQQRWIRDDSNFWMRRMALLTQLKHKQKTNADLLFQLCRHCMQEKEFFIRKAIGWAFREYSKTNPLAVKTFLQEEKSQLSPLSYKEGGKHLMQKGLL